MSRTSMPVLHWFDDSKGTKEAKVQNAVAAYAERFGRHPAWVQVHASDVCDVAGVEVRTTGQLVCSPANYFLGGVVEAGVTPEPARETAEGQLVLL